MKLETFAFIMAILQANLAVGFLLAPTQAAAAVLEVLKNSISRNMLAISWITLAGLVLLDEPRVSMDAAGFIRLMAWLTTVKCLIFIWRPELPIRARQRFFSSAKMNRVIGLIVMALAVTFFWAGFVIKG
jgi:hypothetical protein